MKRIALPNTSSTFNYAHKIPLRVASKIRNNIRSWIEQVWAYKPSPINFLPLLSPRGLVTSNFHASFRHILEFPLFKKCFLPKNDSLALLVPPTHLIRTFPSFTADQTIWYSATYPPTVYQTVGITVILTQWASITLAMSLYLLLQKSSVRTIVFRSLTYILSGIATSWSAFWGSIPPQTSPTYSRSQQGD